MSSRFQPPVRTGLLDFLKNSSGCQFVIPVYQRNYTWTAGKEVKQYLDDLKSVLIGEYSNHFLGIMIYLDTPIDYATREFSVIDGQQRLTTTFLILYAIKTLMKEQGATDAINSLEGQFLTNPFASNDKVKYKLKPLVSDDDVYQDIVRDKIDQIENKDSKIYKNYIYILDYIRELNQSYNYNQILLALNELYVVCIPLSSEDNAQKIFESINATGIKLTASDLIRNFLLMDLDSDKQEQYYKDYWMQLEEYLSDDSKKLESFFRFFLAVKNKSLPNKNAVYKEFVNWYKNQVDKLGREGIFKEVIKYAKYYFEIYQKKIDGIDRELGSAILEFRRILSDMPAPLLMGFYDFYYSGKISSSQLSELIYVVNNYLIRRALCDIDTSGITRMFAPLLKDVEEDCKGNYENIVEILKKNLVFKNINNGMYVPDERQLYDLVVNSNMYSRVDKSLVNGTKEKSKYLSKEDWGRVVNNHEEIISKDVFDEVQELKASKRFKDKNTDYKWHNHSPLQGFLYCPECGHVLAMTRSKRQRKDGTVKEHRYFRCRYCKNDGVKIIGSNADKVEPLVLEAIKVKYDISSEIQEQKKYLIDSDVLIQDLESKKLASYEKYKLGKMTRLDFIEEKKKLDDEIDALKNEQSKKVVQQANIHEEKLTRKLMEKDIKSIIVRGNQILKIEWK